MNASDLIFIGLKASVTAMQKASGQQVWRTELPGGMGDSFVTVNHDDNFIYAHSRGQIHCLDLATGEIRWSNELSGLGYGVASIALLGSLPAPPIPVYERLAEQERQRQQHSHAHSGST
jgi:outer membrane protein assembly factor BamB